MSRLGRSQPVPPFSSHGFVDPGPGPVGTVPPGAVVVPIDPRPRQFYTPQLPPISISGALSSLTLAANPPAPFTVDAGPRARALNPVQPISEHGFVDPGPGPVGTTPPGIVNVDRADQRGRYRPLDPVALSAALQAITQAPIVLPVGPFVVPVDERRRFLASLPPSVTHGLDDVTPPQPEVTEQDGRRRIRPPDPISISGALAALVGPFVAPPGPQSVETTDRRHRLVAESLSISGALATFFAPFVAPPPVLVVFSDERLRRRVPQPIVLSGPAFPVAVVAAIYTQDFGPGSPGGPRFRGDLVGAGLGGVIDGDDFAPGAPAGAKFKPGRPGRG